MPNPEEMIRWQPVMLIIDRRLECQCGALAVIVTGLVSPKQYNDLDEVDCWCYECFINGTKEIMK